MLRFFLIILVIPIAAVYAILFILSSIRKKPFKDVFKPFNVLIMTLALSCLSCYIYDKLKVHRAHKDLVVSKSVFNEVPDDPYSGKLYVISISNGTGGVDNIYVSPGEFMDVEPGDTIRNRTSLVKAE